MPSKSDLSRGRGYSCPAPPAKEWHVSNSDQKVSGLPRRFREPLVYLSAFVVMSLVLFHQLSLRPTTWPQSCPDDDFILAIARRATPDRFIVLALVDAAFADMAINLYKAHLQPNNILNFLFVGAGHRACEILWNASLPCHHYTEDEDSEVASVYLSRDFIRKMNIRTQMILDALNAGFTVLHTDLDVVFLGNPLPDIKVEGPSKALHNFVITHSFIHSIAGI